MEGKGPCMGANQRSDLRFKVEEILLVQIWHQYPDILSSADPVGLSLDLFCDAPPLLHDNDTSFAFRPTYEAGQFLAAESNLL